MFRAEVWLTALLLATGTVGGVMYNWPEPEVEKTVEAPVAPSKQEEQSRGLSLIADRSQQAQPTAPLELDPLRLGDRLLLGGNFIGAYQQYSKLQNQSSGQPDDSLQVRLGVASELGGFLEKAEQHYRDAIQSSNEQSIQKLWALLGTARIWESQDRLDQAISLLSELYLMYENDVYPIELRLPISRRLSECLLKRFLQESLGKENTRWAPIEYFWCGTRIEPMIDSAVRLQTEAMNTPAASLQVIQNPLNDVELALVDANLQSHPLNLLIGDLTRDSGLQITVSPAARTTLSGRTLRANVAAMPVSVLLDQVLAPLGLAWFQQDGVVRIHGLSELTRQQKNSFQIGRMQRSLRQLQLNTESGPERSAALMHDGNVLFAQMDYANAATRYRAARQLQPTGELNAKLYFNEAMLALTRKQREDALGGFYRALDQTLMPQLQALAYAHIAELELELGRPDKAIPAAARGLRLSNAPSRRAKNLMILAKAYLFEEDPFSANQVLFDNSPSLSDPRRQRMASVISTYARFRALKPVSGLQNEGERLVLALAALRPEDPSGFLDHLLISRAFDDVGFRSKAIDHLSIASNNVATGYWENRIRFELADMLYQAGDLDQAKQVLRTLQQSEGSALLIKRHVLEAKIAFGQGDHAACESLCSSLLTLPLNSEAKKETLELLGRTYQEIGKHYAAALCFAGLLPDSGNEDNQQ